jgi:ketosteroid isomerase-like protein
MMQSQVAHATQPDDVTQLIAIDKRMQRAFIDRDWTALDEILTDDYVLVSSSGNELTKQDVLRNAAAPGTRWEINETSDWKVRVRGDTAILVATLHQKGVDEGQPFDSVVKFSDTYIRDQGRWRNVHAHACKLIEPTKN